MKPIAKILTFIIILWVVDLVAQTGNPRFKHLTINDGLSQNAVFSVLQDHKGFMWFGTKDGLNRYDGYSFTIYRHDPFDSTSLSANHITALFEDSVGFIWIGTLDGGLNRFDPKTELIHRFNILASAGENGVAEITAIAQDGAGNLWVGTRDGLFRLGKRGAAAPVTTEVTRYTHDPSLPGSLSNNIVNALLVDSGGNLWVGTDRRLDRWRPHAEKSDFEHYSIFIKNSLVTASRYDSSITAIHEDKMGRLWLGTTSGLACFEPDAGVFTAYPHHYEIHRYGWGVIRGILEDRRGAFWLATPGELMHFEPEKQKYRYFRHDPLDLQSISYNGVSSMVEGRTGILWFGTPGYGINLYDPKASRFQNLRRTEDPQSRIAGFSVRSILEDDTGDLWISTDVLYHYDRKSGELRSFETSSDKADDFGNTGSWSMLQAGDGYIWFATSQGLYRREAYTGKIRQYRFEPADPTGLPQKEVYAVFEDRKGSIWVATANYFSELIDKERGRFRHYRYNHDQVAAEQVRPQIYQDAHDRFWLGTSAGLLRFDPKNELFQEYRNDPRFPDSSGLSSNFIKCICPDPDEPDKVLWLGTAGGGLNRFDMENETFRHFTEDNGLPNSVVYGILADEAGRLWLSTNRGLTRFNRQNQTFRNFDISDGIQSNEFNTGAFFKNRDGEMFFGGIEGLTYFHPAKITDNQHVPPIVITGFRILGQQVSEKDGQPVLQKPISETEEVTLSHRDKIFVLEFAALDFSASEKNQYAYMLENFNTDWIYAGPVRTATYTNLAAGEYLFRVKGSNNDGVWNEAGTTLKIIIKPPPWQTWWATALYAVIVFCVLYGLRQYELNRLRLKSRLKLEQVAGEKLKELDRLKSHFFANISHEFRTPLTLILGQLESVQASALETTTRGKLQIAFRNARRLLRLINELLDLSKLEAGSMTLRAETHNIVSFLKSVVFSFESLAQQKNIELKFESQVDNIPVGFEPEKLEKVFFNLLSNAFKFTPDGTITVQVETVQGSGRGGDTESGRGGDKESGREGFNFRSPSLPLPFAPYTGHGPKEWVRITVRDTGGGIPAEQLPHVFDRFFQAHNPHTRDQEGTGIGLALAKELVELHGGGITVTSEEGVGTEFTVRLPIAAEAGDRKQEAEIPPREAAYEPEFGPEHQAADNQETQDGPSPDSGLLSPVCREIILIVEDNTDVRAYLREQLQESYMLMEATDGEDGLAKAQEVIPDLIITDVMMPKMDGYEFSKEIRRDERTSHIPIIMLTARAALDDKIEGLETGVDAYLVKPFSARELMARVQNLIQQRRELRRRFREATVIKPSDVAVTSVDQAFLESVITTTEARFGEEQFNVTALADAVHMSVSQLNRKLGALIDQPAGQLIRSLRLQRAADLLKQNAGTVAEICYQVGFSDQANFTRAFKKRFGVAPGEFRKYV